MKRVEVFDNDTGRWVTYMLGDWSKPLRPERERLHLNVNPNPCFSRPSKVEIFDERPKSKIRKKKINFKKSRTINIPKDIDEVVLRFPSDVKCIYF